MTTTQPEAPASASTGAAAAAAAAKSPSPMRAGVSRARARVTRTRGRLAQVRLIRWAISVASGLRVGEAGSGSLLADRPASIGDLIAYTRSGDWVPGDRHPALEAAGKAYGYLIAVTGSVALYGAAWVIQRPTRFAVAAAVALIFWATR
jgi:hypothetical protein